MARSSPSRSALVLLVVASVGSFAFSFVWFTLPAYLAPITAEFGLSGAAAGFLAGAVPLMYIPLGLLSGVLIDRMGSRWGIGVGLTIVGVAQLLRAVSADYVTMLAPTLLLGVGATGLTFGLPKLVTDLFEPERASSMSSVYLVSGSLGIAAAFGVGRSVMGPLLGGWRPVFLVTGAATAALAILWVSLVTLLDGDGETSGDPDEALGVAALRRDALQVVGNRNVRLVVVIGTMFLLILHGLQGWLVAILELRGVDPGVAATVASLFVVGQVGGMLTLPVLAERWRKKRPMAALSGCCASVGSVVLLAAQRPVPAGVAVVVVGIGLGGLMPLIVSFPAEIDEIGAGLTATAVGVVFAVGEIGGFGGPLVIGYLHDVTESFAPGLVLLSAGGLVIVAAALSLRGIDSPPESPDSPSEGATPRSGEPGTQPEE